MRFDAIVAWLAKPSFVSRPPEVQPRLATTGGHYFSSGPEAIPPMTTDGYNTLILTAPIVAYSSPDIVQLYGDLPPGFVPGETALTLQNDATGGNC